MIPAVTALVVGGLYTVGAVVKAAELRGAGLRVSETLPLVPIEQLLARGISVAYEGMGVLVSIAVVLLVTAWAARFLGETDTALRQLDSLRERIERKEVTEEEAEAELSRIGSWADNFVKTHRWLTWFPRFPWWYVPLAFAPAMLFFPPLGALAIAILLVEVCRQRLRAPLWHFVTFLLLVILVTAVAQTILYPRPLPAVALNVSEQGEVRGELIASTAGTWYISSARGEWQAIQSGRVRSSRVHSVSPHNKPRRIIRLFLDLF